MARTAIITDSSACLPGSGSGDGVDVLPIGIRTSGEDLRDGAPGAADRVYRALREGEQVKSTAPTPLEYLAAVERSGAESALIVTPAAEYTGMHRAASLAADLAEVPVRVMDSRTAAAAQGLVVRAAARRAAEGLDAALEAARSAAARVDLVATLESLDHLRRSGRVPALALDLARRLRVRPVFRLEGGAVRRLSVPRTEEAALDRVAREWAAAGGADGSSVVFHASAVERASALAERLEVAEIWEFSPSMGIHTGPGVVGVAWLRLA